MSNVEIKDIIEKIEEDKDLQCEVLENCINSIEPSRVLSFLSKYLDTMCITNSKIAELAKRTPQATLSMIKSNEGDFPAAFNIHGTNYYIKKDVIEWLINNNKIPRDENDEVKTEFLYGKKKSIYFTGGPGNGKSTICVSAAESSIVPALKKILTAGGAADTENLIKLHFKNNSVNYVVFHYGDGSNDSIPIRIQEDNVKRIKDELKKCKQVAKEYRSQGDTEKLIGTYVEFVLEPNKMVSKLMQECNIDILTFIDTPGLDSNHSGDSVAVADIIVMVLGDRDDIEAITEKVKENIVPETGTTQYIYLYNNRFALTVSEYAEYERVYEESLAEAKEDLIDYVEGLKNLQNELVIGSTLSACKPLDSLICVPNFSKEPCIIDEFFFEKFCKQIKNTFHNSAYFTELNAIDMDKSGDSFLAVMKEHIKSFFLEVVKGSSYGFSEFINEEHGRTKSLDNYRIEYSFNNTMRELKKYFYERFSGYKTDTCDEAEAAIIRLAYLTINEGLMNRVHYGYGSHPWEDTNSPTQMICEEVLSTQLISEAQNRSYCQVLIANKIKSNSWNYVSVYNTEWNKAKLVVSDHYKFPEKTVDDFVSYIKLCHFVPSILVQTILTCYKMEPYAWNRADYNKYFEVIDNIIK